MKKAIIPFGDPVLRIKSIPITEFDEKLFRLLDGLTDTLYAAEGQAGLAAPQINVPQRVIVIDCGGGKIELINPEILEKQGEQTGPEACLSFPGYYGVVKRAQYVKVKTFTRTGAEIILEGEDFPARCMQHEIDHLDGILYIDHILHDELYNDETQVKADLQAALRVSGK